MSVILAGLTVMAIAGLSGEWMELRQKSIPADRIADWKYGLPVWGLTSLWVFLLSRWIVWLRLKSLKIRVLPLDFLSALLIPLLRDLPPEAVCRLSCNPFSTQGAENSFESRRGLHLFKGHEDNWLDFRVKLEAGCSLALLVRHRRVDKFKLGRKKHKYKGTKQRLALICIIQHPALMRMSETDLRRLNGVGERLKAQRDDELLLLRKDLGKGRMIAIWKKTRFSQQELEPSDMPDAKAVLKTIRLLTAFAMETSGRQESAVISH
ncbi:MAG: hypothetical protein PHE55_12245 [Methylococcaceae bacterium]|nr:hypothetical protein [Methylococcaceae bacterium]